MTTLETMRTGETVEITGYQPGHPAYRAKLLALGLTRGARLTLKNIAPLGDPVELEVRGYRLSLRKAEAAVLNVKAV